MMTNVTQVGRGLASRHLTDYLQIEYWQFAYIDVVPCCGYDERTNRLLDASTIMQVMLPPHNREEHQLQQVVRPGDYGIIAPPRSVRRMIQVNSEKRRTMARYR